MHNLSLSLMLILAQTPRDKKKEFFKEELKRLKNSLQKESEKLVEPAKYVNCICGAHKS